MAIITGSIVGGATGAPFDSARADVEKAGGVEEEYAFEGTATQFRLAGGSTTYSVDGRWDAEPMAEQPFRSRFVVVRPADPTRCNGTVIVTWNNVSRGQDSFGPRVQLLEDGFVQVGVTAQSVGVYGGSGMAGLKEHDPVRYGTLEHPGDGFSYDIFTQAASLVGRDRHGDVDPLGGLEMTRVIATGGSQSANRLATYVNAVQPLGSAFDAFLLTIYAGCPCALDPATAPAALPQVPTNVVQLLPWRTFRLRDDLPVPILVLNSEFEAEQCHPNAQPDTELLRWWEVAGTAHLGMAPEEMIDEIAGMMPGMNTVSFAPTYRAAAHALHRWLETGTAPPHEPRLAKQGDPAVLPRDEHGNALGGIRWPDVEAPLGTHVGESPSEGFANLMGTSTPFPPEKVRSLYADRDAWFTKYRAATEALVTSQVVLPDDAQRMLARAGATELSL